MAYDAFGRPAEGDCAAVEPPHAYRTMISYIERLHRLLLDVIKDEFERLGKTDLNSVQALLLFNIADEEVTAGELKSRGYYQGSNVSYNLKKLVEAGYLHHERCSSDRRSVRIKLTERGREVRAVVADLHRRHAEEFDAMCEKENGSLAELNARMNSLEQFWRNRIRYIY